MPVLPTQLPDHRRSDESTLIDALRARDPLALAEAYHRTVAAANACARRLLQSPAQVEALLRAVYTELWQDPPRGVPIEGWVRARCFALAADDLREHGAAPASPSAATLLPTLPAPQARFLDAAERALSELDDRARTVLLRAHDCGIDARTQGGDAPQALDRALRALAGPEPSSVDASALREDPCTEVHGMGDWVLGLLDTAAAAELEALIARRPGCAALARTLRRGRRRLEGLPPTPDMGLRILATVLSVDAGTASAPPVGDHAATAMAEVTTGDLAATGEMRMPDWPHEAPAPAPVPSAEAAAPTVMASDWAHAPAMTGVATREDTKARVIDLREPREDTTSIAAGRRRDPYAALADLDEASDSLELPDPHRVTPATRTAVERGPDESHVVGAPDLDAPDLDSFYPEEELITRPSIGQRMLVIVGYVLPIVLGAGLGLYIADLLFPH